MTIPFTLQLLVAFGFQPVVKDALTNEVISLDQDANQPPTQMWCKDIASKLYLTQRQKKCNDELQCASNTLSNLTDIVSMLNLHSPFEIILEMREPTVDDAELLLAAEGNRDAWLTWYDSLKVNHELLSSFLVESRQ